MLYNRLWDCLSCDAQNRIRLFQQVNQPSWRPPERLGVFGAPHFSGNTETTPENVPSIMRATPADVKHNRGAFA